MVELIFCDSCGASVPAGRRRCEECNEPVVRARAAPAAGRPRASGGTARGRARGGDRTVWALWGSVAAVVLLISVVFLVRGKDEPVKDAATAITTTAAAPDRLAALSARAEEFRVSWARGDVERIGEFYAPNERRRAARLDDRFAERGWSEQVPPLEEPYIEEHQRGEHARYVIFPFVAGQVRTVWEYDGADWNLELLILPKAEEVAAARAGETETGLTDARPFARVFIGDPDAVTSIPGYSALPSLFQRTLAESAFTPERFQQLVSSIAWPLEVNVWLREGGGAIALRSKNEESFVVPWIGEAIRDVLKARLESMGHDLSASLPRPRERTARVAGAYFAYTPFAGAHVYEGRLHDQHHVVIVFGVPSEKDARGLVAPSLLVPDLPQREDAMWRRTEGGELRLLISLAEALQVLPADQRVQGRALWSKLVGDLSCFSGSSKARDGRYALDFHADLSEGSGVIGALLAPVHEGPGLLGWVPASGVEFSSIAMNPGPLEGLVQVIASLGGSLDPSTWSGEFTRLGAGDLSPILDHVDGRVVLVHTMSSVEDALDPAAVEPFVLLLGADDGPALAAKILQRVAADPAVVRGTASEVAPDVLSIADRGFAPWLYLAPRDHFVAIAIGHAESVDLLKKCLATEGRSKFPDAFTERVASIPANAVWTGLSSILSDASGRFASRSAAGKEPTPEQKDALRAMLEQVAREGGGVNAGWIVVDHEGLRGRIVY